MSMSISMSKQLRRQTAFPSLHLDLDRLVGARREWTGTASCWSRINAGVPRWRRRLSAACVGRCFGPPSDWRCGPAAERHRSKVAEVSAGRAAVAAMRFLRTAVVNECRRGTDVGFDGG